MPFLFGCRETRGHVAAQLDNPQVGSSLEEQSAASGRTGRHARTRTETREGPPHENVGRVESFGNAREH